MPEPDSIGQSKAHPPDEYLTVYEVADLLKLNQQTVRNLIDAGTLPAVRVGRRVRIGRVQLDQFLATAEERKRPPRRSRAEREQDELAVAVAVILRSSKIRSRQKLASALRTVAREAERLAAELEQ